MFDKIELNALHHELHSSLGTWCWRHSSEHPLPRWVIWEHVLLEIISFVKNFKLIAASLPAAWAPTPSQPSPPEHDKIIVNMSFRIVNIGILFRPFRPFLFAWAALITNWLVNNYVARIKICRISFCFYSPDMCEGATCIIYPGFCFFIFLLFVSLCFMSL